MERNEHIRELYYSNGMDVFGPVSPEEFSKNRYYKSTMIWHAGLDGWKDISDCEEFCHLIGTLHAPELESMHAASGTTPPLTQRLSFRPAQKKTLKILGLVAILLAVLALVQFLLLPPAGETPNTAVQAAVPDSNVMEQSELVKTARAEAEKDSYRKNWEKFIQVQVVDFKAVPLGGIRGLQLKLKNSSPYLLDSVRVKISYLRPGGDVYNTEYLQFDLVQPGSEKDLYAPDSKRGVKVLCSITGLRSADMNLCLDKTPAADIRGNKLRAWICP